MNPYWETDFFEFFIVLAKRVCGMLPLSSFPPDEIQLLVLIGISISTALLGTFLTMRKMTMLANSLSHTTLVGIVICFLVTLRTTSDLEMSASLLIISSVASAFLTVILTEGVRHLFKLQEDAAIGLVFTTLFALGILLVTLFTRNSHIGVEVITGNVDALDQSDIGYVMTVGALNILISWLVYRPWALTAFDPQLASTSGFSLTRYHYLQMGLTALTLVVSIRAVGVLLALALLVGPTLIARHSICRLPTLLIGALGIGIFFSVVGVALSRHILTVFHLPISTGGMIVALLSVGYFVSASLTFRAKSGLIGSRKRRA